MRHQYYFTLLALTAFCLGSVSYVHAQGDPDCVNATPLCSDASISFNPSGIGSVNDFASGANDSGCLTIGENNTAWYYFEFNSSMPPGSELEFTITPQPSADYDFAVYGPGAGCGNLGSPIRCSYAAGSGPTGLGSGATDFSESALGDGFVAPLAGNPGDGFYLVIDNYSGNGAGFNMDFGGDAAQYLNCNPFVCDIMLNYGTSYTSCSGGAPFSLVGSITGTNGGEIIIWDEPSGGTAYMNDPTSPNPILTFPSGVSGNFQYTLTVTEGTCMESITINVNVSPPPFVEITGDNALCPGQAGILNATPGYVAYTWSPSGSGPNLPISAPGLYSVTVLDAAGCEGMATFNVDPLPEPIPVIIGPSQLCAGASGVLELTDFYDSYIWQDGSTDPTLVIFSPGFYSVTVTQNGCTGMSSFEVLAGSPPPVTISGNLSFCSGGSTILSATPGYPSYQWSNGLNTPSITVITPGTYSVTVDDGSGCSGEATVDVTETPPPVPAITGNLQICTTNGSTVLSATPGFVSYQWSNGMTTPDITVAAPGTYTVTVTDASNCTGEASVDVFAIPDPIPDITGDLSFCVGSSTTLSATPGYDTYQWSTGGIGETITVSTPGPVSVTVTDASGCTGSASVNLTQNPPPTPTISGPNLICGSDPVVLTADPGYDTYQWYDGTTGESVTISGPGTFGLTITDAFGCTGSTSYTVNPAPPVVASIQGTTSFCEGSSSQLFVSGGPYIEYLWSDGSTEPSYTATFDEPVSVTVTNSSGCTGTASANIFTFPLPTPTITGVLTFCENQSTQLTVSEPFSSYDWSTGQSGASVSITSPGTITVTVTDDNGCQGENSVVVSQSPSPVPTISGIPNYCEGSSTQLMVNEPFDAYIWSNGATTAESTISTPGPATVTVTNASGCTGEASILVNAFPAPTPTIAGTPIFCTGQPAQLSVDGGTFVEYDWYDGQTTPSVELTLEGTASVTVTDVNGCQGEASTFVDALPDPMPTLTGDLAFCEGGSTILGLAETYVEYDWYNAATTPTTSVSIAGPVSVTVTDANGCEGTTDAFVDQLMLPSPSIDGPDLVCPGTDAQLMVTESYAEYEWSTTSTNSTITTNTAGDYNVTVTDDAGCEGVASFTLGNHPAPSLPNDLANDFCAGGSTTLSAPGGFATYEWEDGTLGPDLLVSTPGNYAFTVTDDNGCEASTTFAAVENALPSVSISGELDFCEGANTTLAAPPGLQAYQWGDGSTGSSITADIAGVYALTVTDDNGCQNNTSVTVVENSLPDATITGLTSFCPGGTTQLQGPAGMTTYAWSTNSSASTIEVSAADTYQLTVTDANGCQNSSSVAVTQVEELMPQIAGVPAYCAGENTTLDAGDGYQSYAWTGGATGQTLVVNSPGTYGLTVTDLNGCEGETSILVTENPLPDVSISGETAYCAGLSTSLDATAGLAAYLWQDSSMVSGISATAPGVYTVTATDNNGCSSTASVTVQEYALPTPQITGNLSFCPEGNTSLGLSDSYVDYAWSTGTDTTDVLVDQAGTYAVTVTDANGCTAADTVTTSLYDSPVPIITGVLALCEGNSTELTATAGYQSYQWSDGSFGPSITASDPGSISVDVVDNNGCTGTASVSLDVQPLPIPSIQAPATLCEGSTAELTTINTYSSYQWSTGADSTTAAISTGGTYSVTVADTNGCEGTTNATVTGIPSPEPVISGVLDICPGDTAALSANPGYESYLWSSGEATPAISTDAVGNYTVTVTDETGCEGSVSAEVAAFAVAEPAIAGPSAFCPGTSAVLTGEAGFESYTWSNNTLEAATTVMAAGDYTLIVVDANGCTTSSTATVSEYQVTPPDVQGDDFCAGGTTTLQAELGYAIYEWSNGATTADNTVNTGGIYELTATDNNGCISNAAINVAENPLPDVTIGGSTSFCTSGFTTLNAGSDYESYAWSTGSGQPSIQVNAVGNYGLTVTDANGCQNSTSVSVTEASELSPVISGPLSFCPGLETTLDAGAGFATYAWSNGGQEQFLTTNAPGDYGLTVTDAAGCQGSTLVTVAEYPAPMPMIDAPAGFCMGATADLAVLGDFASYDWNEGSITQGITIAAGGSYDVTVVDANGCVASTSTSVELYPLPVFDLSGAPEYCFGASTTITATEGFVEYAWSEGTLEAAVEIDAPGTYVVTVTDAQGCSEEQAITVAENPLPDVDILGETNICFGGSTTLSSSGQFESYEWSTGSSDASISTNTPGNYTLLVIDAAGCSQTTSITINEGEVGVLEITGNTAFCPGTSTDLGVAGGYATYEWSNGATDPVIVVNTAGNYGLTVTDEQGCISEGELAVDTWPAPLPAITAPAGFCVGDTAVAVVTGGTFESYQWSNGADEATLPVYVAGAYTVLVTDANQCQATATATLEAYELPEFTILGATTFCEDESTALTASIDLADYQWSTGSTEAAVEVTETGTYVLTGTDEFGCSATVELAVAAIELPTANAGAEAVINCYETTVTIGLDQGNSYAYSWSGPGINPSNMMEATPSVDTAGTYTLVITDVQYGCASTPATVDVADEADLPVVFVNVLDVLDCTTSTVVISAEGSAEGTNIIYQWFDQNNNSLPATSMELEVSTPAIYYLQVTDTLSGCFATDSVAVQENEAYPIAEAGPAQALDCATTEVILDGGNAQQGATIAYAWTTPSGNILTGATTDSALVNQPGWYYFEVSDNVNGCSNIDSVLVTQDVELPVAVVSGAEDELDCLNPVVPITGQGSSLGAAFSYTWALGTVDNVVSNDLDYQATEPGTYYFTVFNADNQCTTTATLALAQNNAAPEALSVEAEIPTCFGDSDGFIGVTDVTGGTPPYSYSFDGGIYTSTSFFTNLTAGVYDIAIQDANGCPYELTYTLEDGNDLALELGEDIEVQVGEEVDLTAIATVSEAEIISYNWQAVDPLSCVECLQTTVSPTISGLYSLEIMDVNGCVASDQLLIFVDKRHEVYVPNAFSPNGDDSNESFYVQGGADAIKLRSFLVFDRWGEPVYEAYNAPVNDPFFGWDGTHRGQLMNSAVFVWYTEVEFVDGTVELFKGDVLLMR